MLFSFSQLHGVLPESIVKIMTAVVALSMAVTPLLMMLLERLILPGLIKVEQARQEADAIDERNPVIIAGFGHFGNTVGRFLRANRVAATYLDLDADRVDLLRKMRFKVYYGDASRHDLLQAAGADKAKIIIIAIDDANKRLEMIETIKKHFPNLRMLVRSTNRFDAYDLMNAGMLHVYRETVDTSVRMGVDVMEMLGYRSYAAKRAARLFMKHDEANLKKLAAIRNQEEYILAASEYIEDTERAIQQDILDIALLEDDGWDAQSLMAEANARPDV